MDSPTKGGRPASFDREAAVEAAMTLFCQRGYLSVSVSDLAHAMAVQRSSFYNSFGSRESVFEEALRRYAQVAPDAALDRVQPGEAVMPVVARVLRRVCHLRSAAAHGQGQGCMLVKCAAEAPGEDMHIGHLVQAALQARLASLERLLKQAAAQGEIGAGVDTETTARGLMALLLGLSGLAKIVQDEERLWSTCRLWLQAHGLPPEGGDGPSVATP